MSAERLRTRSQRIVAALESSLAGVDASQLGKTRARARSLPAMLRRHGPLQVLLFLEAKGSSDKDLAEWLLEGTRAALAEASTETPPSPQEFAAELSELDLPIYQLRWEAALDAAGWLKMLIEARTEPTSNGEAAAEEDAAEEDTAEEDAAGDDAAREAAPS